jgi:Holliday junction resolvase RusA-like endonuclease
MSEPLTFTVYGRPAPAGSKRFVPAGGKRGGRPLVIDDSKRSRPWKQDVAAIAGEAMAGRELLVGPLELVLVFYLARPKGHYGARGVLPSAPEWPIVKPDVLKLARAVEDALTGQVWRDDAQVVLETISKRYGDPERVVVTIHPPPAGSRGDATIEPLR